MVYVGRRKSKKRDATFAEVLRGLLPRVTLHDFNVILEIAQRGHLRHLPPTIATWQATTTHIRHNHTDYNALLEEGYDSESARHFVLDSINDKLAEWGSTKLLEENEE